MPQIRDQKTEASSRIYLGDSIYAEKGRDGHIRLSVNNGFTDAEIIYLEPAVAERLFDLAVKWGTVNRP